MLILLALREESLTKTRLMQELILGYKRVNSYCDMLMCKGLIKYDPGSQRFSITPKGTEVLTLSKELAGYILPIEQMIKRYSFYIEGQYEERKNASVLSANQI
jgi:predicted transcriptional regulator